MTATVTTARAATVAVKRALRDAELAVPVVRSYNAALGEPAQSTVFTTGPEAVAVLAQVPGATKVEDHGSFIAVSF